MCELAWAVARRGAEAQPPVPPPRRLVPLLRMAKLPPRALATILGVLDQDEAFRERVAAVPAGEDELGRAGWLFLHRPEGWEGELAALVEQEEAAAAEVEAARERREAARRLAGAEAARRRAEERAGAAEARADTAEARADAAERRAAEAEARAAAAEGRAAAAEGRAAAAEARADAAERRAAEAEGRAAAAEQRAAAAERQARAAAERQARAAAEPAVGGAEDRAEAALQSPRPSGPEGATVTSSHVTGPVPDLAALGRAIADAAAAAARLADRLAAAAAVLGAGPPEAVPAPLGTASPEAAPVADEPQAATGTPGTAPPVPGAAVPVGGSGRPVPGAAGAAARPSTGPGARAGAGRPRRSPTPLPPGILDDTPEAAEHLVRRPGTLLVVDGYNTTLTDLDWASLPIAEQRQRLIDALRELAARTGVEAEVVFDGAEHIGPTIPSAAARHGVRVAFSAPDEEADDLILRRVAACPPARPVVVASSDRRVRDGAARLGANVIGARQLMSLLRARP